MEGSRFAEDSHKCYSCLQSTLNAYVSFLSMPASIMGIASHITKKDPQFLYKLLDLGLNTTGLANTKKILTSALSFLMVSIHNNNTSMLEDIMKDLEKDINNAIENNSKSMKEIRNIHNKMIMLISTNRSIQKFIPIKEKRNEPVTLQLDLWRKTTEKIEYLFRLVLTKSSENSPLSEFVLSDILRFFKNYITMVDIKNQNEPLIRIIEPSDKIEEEKLPDEPEEEEDEESSLPEEELDSEVIRMDMSEVIREDEESKSIKPSGTPFERFGLKLVQIENFYMLINE